MAYQAYVVKLKTAPHPNADRLQIGFVSGSQVVVGGDTKDGELVLYFPSDGQLSKEYANANDLIARKDDMGNKIGGGYFDEKRRVKSQNFRKVRSEGFVMPLTSLEFTNYDISKLKEGDAIDNLNGVPICNKYFTKATLAAIGTKKKVKMYADFPEHFDTAQFRFVHVPAGAVLYFTEKEHGTSVRYGNVLVHKPYTHWWDKVRKFVGLLKGDYHTTRQYVLGTRRAILPKQSDTEFGGGYYGNGDPYDLAAQKLHGKLKDDEIVYGEIVGYLKTGASLFTQSTEAIPEIKKEYGPTMTFSYGCVESASKFRVYRITQNGRELSRNEVVHRCEQLGVDMCTDMGAIIYDGDRDALNARVASMLEGPSLIDTRHIREGICIRIESPEGIRIVKAKSWTFGVLEGYIKDNDNYVDMEEVA